MHHKQNNKESKTFVQGLRRFGNTLPRGIRGILKKSGYNYSEIIGKWNQIVGKNISSYAFPKSIKMNRNNTNGILVLSVKRGNEIDIEYSKKEIVDKINAYFGYKLIGEVKLQILNKSDKKNKKKHSFPNLSSDIEKKIYEIKNTNIKNSLMSLVKTIKND